MLYACNLVNCKGNARPVIQILPIKHDDDDEG